jgi:hypothetical protein
MALVVNSNEETSGSTVNETKFLTGEAHGGCVDDGHELLNIFREEAVK